MTMKVSTKMKHKANEIIRISPKTLYELAKATHNALECRHYLSAESYARAMYNLCFDFDSLKRFMREAHTIDTCIMVHDYDGAAITALHIMQVISSETISESII